MDGRFAQEPFFTCDVRPDAVGACGVRRVCCAETALKRVRLAKAVGGAVLICLLFEELEQIRSYFGR